MAGITCARRIVSIIARTRKQQAKCASDICEHGRSLGGQRQEIEYLVLGPCALITIAQAIATLHSSASTTFRFL
jgi:hypothetical protein